MYKFEIEITTDDNSDGTITCRYFTRTEDELFAKLDKDYGKSDYRPGRCKRRYVGGWEVLN